VIGAFADNLPELLLWGLIATIAMTTILAASQGLGFSRLSLPFLVGTIFTHRRARAAVLGFILYVLGGWLFAMLYFLVFISIGVATWWLGALLGVLHGIFLLVCALPLLPYAHPRMASGHDGPCRTYMLEPPGFLGLHYGVRTPLTLLVAQAVYGATLGGFCQLTGVLDGSSA
jgi:hypothetical protein